MNSDLRFDVEPISTYKPPEPHHSPLQNEVPSKKEQVIEQEKQPLSLGKALLQTAVAIAFPFPAFVAMVCKFAYALFRKVGSKTSHEPEIQIKRTQLLENISKNEPSFEELLLSSAKANRSVFSNESSPLTSVGATQKSTTESLSDEEIQKILHDTFPHTIEQERDAIEIRLNEFAVASDIDPSQMYHNIAHGKKLAEQIENGTYNKPPSTQDVIDFEWFLRAQHAKLGTMYLKGAMKFPDPKNKVACFLMNARGTFHGQTGENIAAYARMTSHWREKEPAIESSVLKFPDGNYACFSPAKRSEILRDNPNLTMDNILYFKHPGVGIDASERKGERMGLSGENNTTVLVMFFPEQDQTGIDIPVVALKNESYGVPSIGSAGYGSIRDRFNSNRSHLQEAIEKKGPKVMQKARTVVLGFEDRKEDKLPESIRQRLKEIDLTPLELADTAEAKRLKQLHHNLIATTALSEYALPELHAYLTALLPHITHEGQKGAIESVLDQIEAINHDNRSIATGWEHQLAARSEEIILPTLHEMLEDKVPFRVTE